MTGLGWHFYVLSIGQPLVGGCSFSIINIAYLAAGFKSCCNTKYTSEIIEICKIPQMLDSQRAVGYKEEKGLCCKLYFLTIPSAHRILKQRQLWRKKGKHGKQYKDSGKDHQHRLCMHTFSIPVQMQSQQLSKGKGK